MIQLVVNDQRHELEVEPEMPLLWLLRDRLGLTGTKYGCGRAFCGACTVHVDGRAARACAIMAGEVFGRSVTTIEGLSGPIADAVLRAWQDLEVVQCGYCQPGQVMQAAALLALNRRPTDSEIDAGMDGNLCRCGTYQRIRRAIHAAARALA